MPAWWWVARVVIPIVCILSAVGVFLLTQPDVEEAQDVATFLSKTKAFLLAAPVVLLLAPCRDSDLIASSRMGIILPQLRTLMGCLLSGMLVFVVNFCMAFARVAGWEAYLLYAVVTVCVCLLPFFYRLPSWRVVVAVLLLMSAFVPIHMASFY